MPDSDAVVGLVIMFVRLLKNKTYNIIKKVNKITIVAEIILFNDKHLRTSEFYINAYCNLDDLGAGSSWVS